MKKTQERLEIKEKLEIIPEQEESGMCEWHWTSHKENRMER